jgi:hypothetical protein
MANALILHGLFAEFPTQFLQGILGPNLIPSREFGALLEIPTRRDFVGRRPAAALAGPAAALLHAYTALLTMCGSRLSLSLRPRPKAQVRPRPGEWPALGDISGPILAFG